MTSVNELNAKKQERDRIAAEVRKLPTVSVAENIYVYVSRDEVLALLEGVGQYMTNMPDGSTHFSDTMPEHVANKNSREDTSKKE